jgi:hypothetical protein
MTYEEYEKALSAPRIGKYLWACKGNKNKALILYRYNIKLCQKFYGMLCMFEVVLRNAIDAHFKTQLGDYEWIENQATSGFLIDNKVAIFKERDKLKNRGVLTNDKLVASLSLGVWTIMFSKNIYRKSGKTLLQIFPNKTHGLSQAEIYKELDRIREFRNRIAHHEPLCFDNTGAVDVEYAKDVLDLIIKYAFFMGYEGNELFRHIENPTLTMQKIKILSKTI